MNITIPRVVINLISNTVKVQVFVLLSSLYACIQNCVRALRLETMHSPKTR